MTNIILDVNSISKRIKSKVIVDDFSLKLYEGDILGFVGANGAGKTTTIKLLLGLQTANGGIVRINGFDLKLEKFITKVVVQNNKGTSVSEYNDATLAKTEIHAKQISGTTVIVEYKIRVTNEGAIAGYDKKVVDYIPQDMKFSSGFAKH